MTDDEFVILMTMKPIGGTVVVEDALEDAGIEYRKDDSNATHRRTGTKSDGSYGTIYLVRRSQVEQARRVIDSAFDEYFRHKQDRKDHDTDASCLVCGTEIREDQQACPKCGWTFAEQDP